MDQFLRDCSLPANDARPLCALGLFFHGAEFRVVAAERASPTKHPGTAVRYNSERLIFNRDLPSYLHLLSLVVNIAEACSDMALRIESAVNKIQPPQLDAIMQKRQDALDKAKRGT